MLKRYSLAAAAALGVTVGLFFLMQWLIAMGEARITEDDVRRVIDFVRIKHESQLETRKRALPNKQTQQEEAPTPSMDLPQSTGPGGQAVRIDAPAIDHDVRLTGGPHMTSAPSDMNITPLVRVEPMYPRAAAERRIEGWVWVRFTISMTGTVKNAVVVGAEPPGVFDRAAINAIQKWKYKPRIENGVPVEQPDVEVRLTFKIENGG